MRMYYSQHFVYLLVVVGKHIITLETNHPMILVMNTNCLHVYLTPNYTLAQAPNIGEKAPRIPRSMDRNSLQSEGRDTVNDCHIYR